MSTRAGSTIRRVPEAEGDAGRMGPIRRVDHGQQEAARGILQAVVSVRKGAHDAPGLQLGETTRQLMARSCGEKEALAAVCGPGPLLDEALLDELLEDAVEALLGDAQDVQKLGDGKAGLPVDEVEDAVMSAAEVAIGEKEQLDQIVGRLLLEDVLACRLPDQGRLRQLRHPCTRYVSLVDISQPDCYPSSPATKLVDGRSPAREGRPGERPGRSFPCRFYASTNATAGFGTTGSWCPGPTPSCTCSPMGCITDPACSKGSAPMGARSSRERSIPSASGNR